MKVPELGYLHAQHMLCLAQFCEADELCISAFMRGALEYAVCSTRICHSRQRCLDSLVIAPFSLADVSCPFTTYNKQGAILLCLLSRCGLLTPKIHCI